LLRLRARLLQHCLVARERLRDLGVGGELYQPGVQAGGGDGQRLDICIGEGHEGRPVYGLHQGAACNTG
jgi:hypothetical protein